MLPPSPLTLPLWGAAVWAGFAAGLWRAFAAPWLAPGSPVQAAAAPSPEAGAGAAASAAAGRDPESAAPAAPPGWIEPVGGGRVIRVPQARWRERRG